MVSGVPVGTHVPVTGGMASSTGMPPASTLELPAMIMPLTQGPLAGGGGGKAQPAIMYDAGMVTTGWLPTSTFGLTVVHWACPPCIHITMPLMLTMGNAITSPVAIRC